MLAESTKNNVPTVTDLIEDCKSQVFASGPKGLLSRHGRRSLQVQLTDLRQTLRRNDADDTSTKATATNRHEEHVAVLDLMLLLNQLHLLLDEFDSQMATADLVPSAQLMIRMREILDRCRQFRSIPDYSQNVVEHLQKGVLARNSLLQQTLEDYFAVMFNFSQTQRHYELKFTPSLRGSPTYNLHEFLLNVADVLRAIKTCGGLPTFLARFATRMSRNFISPITHDCSLDLTIHQTKFSRIVILRPKQQLGVEPPSKTVLTSIADCGFALRKLVQLSTYLKDFLTQDATATDAEEVLDTFSLFWERECTAHIRDMYAAVVSSPSVQAGLSSSIADIANDIQGFITDCQLQGLKCEPMEGFTSFMTRLTERMKNKERASHLKYIKSVLTTPEVNTIQVPGKMEKGDVFSQGIATTDPAKQEIGRSDSEVSESKFNFPACRVSVQVHTLVEMAHNAFQNLDEKSKDCNSSAYYAVRDILDSFRALLLADEGHMSHDNLAGSAVFYNNCEYICFHLIILVFKHKGSLAYPLNQMGSFLDLIPEFRSLGESCFRKQMRRQRSQLLTSLETLTFCEVDDNIPCQAETAMNSALNQYSELCRTWKLLLAEDFFLKAIGQLLDAFLKIRYILALAERVVPFFSKIVDHQEIPISISDVSHNWPIYKDICALLAEQSQSRSTDFDRVRTTLLALK
ncbi:Centromere/kinetochore Zw10-domain-containing protein [Phlyctochytrium arcticum]|nr:Centromere/kinetochore Zw10-domain-containing protein [Phlyctochytrium arcticum]